MSQKQSYTETGIGSRLLLYVVLLAGIVAVIYGATSYFSQDTQALVGADIGKTGKGGANVKSAAVSPAYAALNAEANQKNLVESIEAGESSVPSVVGSNTNLLNASKFLEESRQGFSRNKVDCTKSFVEKARKSGVSAFELRCQGCSISVLKSAGITAVELAKAGYDATELREAGFSAKQLLDAGYSPKTLRQSGFTASDMLQAGVPLTKLRESGFSARALREGGASLDDLKDADYTSAQILASGVSMDELNQHRNCKPINDKWNACQDARINKSSGVELTSLYKPLSCSPEQLLDIGYTVTELKMAGYSAQDIACSRHYLEDSSGMAKALLDAGFSQSSLPKDHALLQALLSKGESVDDLKKLGFSCEDLARSGVNVKKLLDSGCTVSSLAKAGISATELKKNGVSAAQLRLAGYSAADVAQAGYSPKELIKGGYTPAALRAAGVSAAELNSAGVSSAQLKAAGFTDGDLVRAGVSQALVCTKEEVEQLLAEGKSATQIKAEGCSARVMEQAGVSLSDLKAAGFSSEAMKDAGFSAKELMAAGFSPEQLKQAGYSPAQLLKSGLSQSGLQALGFSDEAIKQALQESPCTEQEVVAMKQEGLPLAKIKERGCSAKLLSEAGYSAKQLLDAGFEAKQLVAAGYSPSALKEAGVSAEKLLSAGVTQSQLRAAGYSQDDIKRALTAQSHAALKKLVDAGFSREQLQAAGFSGAQINKLLHSRGDNKDGNSSLVTKLLDAGYSAKQLEAAGFSNSVIEKALCQAKKSGEDAKALLVKGFSVEQLKQAGCFSLDDLLKAGVSPKALLADGYTAKQLVDAGVSANTLQSLGVSRQAIDAALGKTDSTLSQRESLEDVPENESQQDAAARQLRELERSNREQAAIAEQQALINQVSEQMNAQYRSLVQGWSPDSFTQSQSLGPALSKEELAELKRYRSSLQASPQARVTSMGVSQKSKVMLPTGAIEYATLKVGINTDTDSPVLARVETGPLKSSVLVGRYQLQNDRLVIVFDKINGPMFKQTQSISAQAIDAETAQAVVKGSVNRHLFSRYGISLLSSFVYGYGDAYATYVKNSTKAPSVTVNGGGNDDTGQTVTVGNAQQKPSAEEFAASSLQSVGSQLNNLVNQEVAKIPQVTVKVPAGQMIGVMILSDFQVNQ